MIGDGRVPLWLCASVAGWSATRRGHAALLAIGDVAMNGGWLVTRHLKVTPRLWGGHGVNCPCCQPHDEVAQALNLLFQDRVRHRCGEFGEIALLESSSRIPARAASLNANRLVEARYRLRLDATTHDGQQAHRISRRPHFAIDT
ncbi:hypothetical protein AA101099_2891 [Neoasaia chiangmaiensis NBRC 101099]|uniref:Uncharacterized protein n=1 Tax=Neoasaia chiangmaiensis TaxID=320497 RepID=A0A1U9KP13_9PROT|nr:hypothetical protein [Neoasaia chiangmaiensis]AQS87493.1 hypothetical protein A0U93_05580 [Neoasaia chiangmaiensis]GBR42502.1 hypothetical protein AA101099_2891 [Neoasaia chiangmaiensis NBRC 101099]GEN16289.1 hypothetical protein NCH01_27200 [Neoasaia chiangmaiensis]